MCVGDVANVGEIEEVGVVAELESVFASDIGVVDIGHVLRIAFAEDACGAEGEGEEFGGGAVGGYDEGFCFGLREC